MFDAAAIVAIITLGINGSVQILQVFSKCFGKMDKRRQINKQYELTVNAKNSNLKLDDNANMLTRGIVEDSNSNITKLQGSS
jgi:hypothetical protein